jgi:hypothetical protein
MKKSIRNKFILIYRFYTVSYKNENVELFWFYEVFAIYGHSILLYLLSRNGFDM